MRSDNIYECAGDFEQYFLTVGEYIDKNTQTPQKKKDFSEIQDQLEKMEHCCNQMDLEANLMEDDELEGMVIHKTCRVHYNDVRKKIRSIEETNTNGNVPVRTPYWKGFNNGKKHGYDSQQSTCDEQTINDVDSSRQTIQNTDGIEDLRGKYGVTTIFPTEDNVSPELMKERVHRIRTRRLLYVVFICIILMALYWTLSFFISGSNTDLEPKNNGFYDSGKRLL